MNLPQVLVTQVDIPLRSPNISMTGDQLSSAQIASLFYDARDHTVAEGVGRDLLCLGDQLFQVENLVAQRPLIGRPPCGKALLR